MLNTHSVILFLMKCKLYNIDTILIPISSIVFVSQILYIDVLPYAHYPLGSGVVITI